MNAPDCLPGAECAHFHKGGTPAGQFVDFLDRTPLKINHFDDQTFGWLQRFQQVLDQLPGC